MKILLNKSSVHYRADFDVIAAAHPVAKAKRNANCENA
jgi:microcystin degradation protein MlrC